MPSELINKYFRTESLPHIWCPGCGNGIITRAIVKAIDNLNLKQDDVCIVSGIGCSSRASGYLDFNTVHTTHGRALAFATGIKFANPNLHVIVITGDGDCAAIGGNHLIHAARRNIDLTTVVFNNNIYGMTGGQYSPTTPTGDKGTTAPYGNIDANFDLCELAKAAGATYVSRSTVYSANMIIKQVEEGIKNKGFSFIEAISICPTYYGRKNKKGDAVDMMKYLKDNSINKATYEKLSKEEQENKIVVGEIYKTQMPEYTEKYQKIIELF
ncbi:2-oxoglutarate ferredoxin oxidoreductase beta subunit [Keratinibaculum paraultunense]|uniref:2-oxoglutarate ferredoxin oxidoreductase beta subunit n=1 Tax=Keratinibaculum paraultunense TaxID=1278232 RepID=A0A4R3L091_9FIRM|nr:2-oxoacid:ferredoxin oxidoreductase subunit beta [Keratinibaculum paraultunense]QQY80647.1 2-oxoacid:ferredoxin oxidoreductase subunit beta [Keratinibaculum paraultunense]TCS91382.1 2-oxoglutarate ferredoxin oxidoreductase beta subunit [Keratinibaculum paraultunense]